MDFLASLDSLEPRVSLALAFLAPLVYQEYPELKDTQDQREIPVSLVALVHLDDLDSMVLQALKVSPVYMVYLEPVARLDPPPLAHWGLPAHLEPLAQWDHQARKDSPEEMEQRETLVLQV